jgi:hypothetical protein
MFGTALALLSGNDYGNKSGNKSGNFIMRNDSPMEGAR